MNDRVENQGKHVVIHDNNRSGALLAWEYFHPGAEVPMLIKHVDDYDRWQFKLDGTKAFNKALWSHAPWSFEQWDRQFCDAERYSELYAEGDAILRAHDQNVQSVVKGSARVCAMPIPNKFEHPSNDAIAWVQSSVSGFAANCPPHLTSDVGHELANQSGTFGLCWNMSQTKMVANCSLRSTGDYDVSAIAKAFGGGGHRNAAGFEVPIETLLGWLK